MADWPESSNSAPGGWDTVRRALALIAVSILMLTACSDPPGTAEAASSILPRTTDNGIVITVTENEELLPVAGCHTFWSSQGKEPPAGACEQTTTVRRYVARNAAASVESWIDGDIQIDPLYAMNLVARDQANGMTIVVVSPPSDATTIRLVDSAGGTLDRVSPVGRLVALAAMSTSVSVEALSDDGAVIAACPHGGIVIDGVEFPCTIARGEEVPVTTVPVSGG